MSRSVTPHISRGVHNPQHDTAPSSSTWLFRLRHVHVRQKYFFFINTSRRKISRKEGRKEEEKNRKEHCGYESGDISKLISSGTCARARTWNRRCCHVPTGCIDINDDKSVGTTHGGHAIATVTEITFSQDCRSWPANLRPTTARLRVARTAQLIPTRKSPLDYGNLTCRGNACFYAMQKLRAVAPISSAFIVTRARLLTLSRNFSPTVQNWWRFQFYKTACV